MPFSADAFLDVFAAYNMALWPFAVVLWLVTAAVFAAFVLGSRVGIPLAGWVLAGHWLWVAMMYHAFFFTAINPAAWLFAAFFGVQAALFVRMVPASEPPVVVRRGSPRHLVSSVLIAYGLAYPLIAWLDGFAYPRMPTFGVPCPTSILTIGFLIAVPTSSYVLAIIPITWSLIAGSAAWLFGIHADLVLPAAGVLLAADLCIEGVMS